LEYKRVVSCKDSFHATDVLAVSEHGAPGRRPNIHTHCRPAFAASESAVSTKQPQPSRLLWVSSAAGAERRPHWTLKCGGRR